MFKSFIKSPFHIEKNSAALNNINFNLSDSNTDSK